MTVILETTHCWDLHDDLRILSFLRLQYLQAIDYLKLTLLYFKYDIAKFDISGI